MIAVAFTLDRFVEPSILKQICQELFFEDVVQFDGLNHGVLHLQKEHHPTLSMLLSTLMGQGVVASLVVGYKENRVLDVAREFAFRNMKNQVVHLADCLIAELTQQQDLILTALLDELDRIDRHHIQTVAAYLNAGLNASLAAELLYIHRNTFTYRLNQFIDLTKLDVRDFHVARLIHVALMQGRSK